MNGPSRHRHPVRDPSLPHQIIVGLTSGGLITVGCNCLPQGQVLEARELWQPPEPIQVWRQHMAAVEVA